MGNVESPILVLFMTAMDTTNNLNFTIKSRSSDYSNTTLCSKVDFRSNSNRVLQIGAQLAIAFLMLGLGCTTEFRLMWKYIKAPKQICTGIILQLVFLPIWGCAFSQIFMMSEAESMGVIIQASCPGGVYSNLASYWLDGDMDLSIVLTCISTMMAIGTLPFWLFVLPKIKGLENKCLKIPFDSLGFTMLGIIAPVILGLVIKLKLPKVAYVLSKICAIVGSLVVTSAALFMAIAQGPYIFPNLYWKTLLFCILFPSTGVLCGYLASKVPWLTFSAAARITVAIETAMQNAAVAMTIILMSYSTSNQEYFGALIVIPFMYGVVQIGSSLVIVVVYLIMKHKGHCKCPHLEEKRNLQNEKERQSCSNQI